MKLGRSGIWRLTGYYGYLEQKRHRDSWFLLQSIAVSSHLPWCCIGDFNDLLAHEEKQGRCSHPNWLISGFREATDVCGLMDLGMVGYQFTWEKSRGSRDCVEERLDRAMATQSWILKFPNSIVYSVEAATSDHLPIFLDYRPQQQRRLPKRFRFENSWLHEDGCGEVVKTSW